jgi:hypothetical protein
MFHGSSRENRANTIDASTFRKLTTRFAHDAKRVIGSSRKVTPVSERGQPSRLHAVGTVKARFFDPALADTTPQN